MRIGDRVKYIGEARPNLEGREGYILGIDHNLCNAEVEFDAIAYPEGHTPVYVSSTIKTIPIGKLELLFHNNVIDEIPRSTEEQVAIYKKYNRQFDTGATRDVDDYKYDYEAFFTPYVMNRYAQYMHQHRIQEDGTMRDGDNWQKGIPDTAYMKSMFRHFFDVWSIMRGLTCKDPKTNKEIELEEALCGLKFNVDGLLFNILKEKNPVMYNGVKQFKENNGN
jgi:hypothetical protein